MTAAVRVRQALLIARLEMGRAFFSKRAFWVYLLALFPSVVFVGHGIDVSMSRSRWARQVTAPELLEGLAEGQMLEEVRQRLGKPVREESWSERRENREHVWMQYFDGGNKRTSLHFLNGILTSINTHALVDFDEDRLVLATMFQVFYLRLAIFFGCLGIFMNLFRGEMLDKTLHYWLLGPARREVLLAGKYLAGLTASVVIFSAGTAILFYCMLWYQNPAEVRAYWTEQGAAHLFWYLAAAVLGCVGYGSVFLAVGLLVRNPIVPAATLLVWEAANPFLPAALQKVSVLYYLQSLCPVPMKLMTEDEAPALLKLLFAPAEPATAVGAVAGIVAVTAMVLWAASRAVRRLEINYGTE